MENIKEKIDVAVSRILSARTNLRSAQAEARNILLELISKKKKVTFKPSPVWEKDVLSGREHALANALDEEGVQAISYTVADAKPGLGNIHSIGLDSTGAVVIEVLDSVSEELIEIREDDTWDTDLLLEFVRVFGED